MKNAEANFFSNLFDTDKCNNWNQLKWSTFSRPRPFNCPTIVRYLPIHLLVREEADMLKKVDFDWEAIHFPIRVFPVPGKIYTGFLPFVLQHVLSKIKTGIVSTDEYYTSMLQSIRSKMVS